MLEIKGNKEEIERAKDTLISSDTCFLEFKYCKKYDFDCEKCTEENIRFINTEEI